jgi:hypothetical protein
MKFTFISDRCTALIDLSNEVNESEVKQIYDKMAHVLANFHRISNVALEQARNKEEKEIINNELFSGIDELQCDLDNAYDEFYLLYNNQYLDNICCHIEVVTPEVAEENDREWLRDSAYTDEDRASYKLCEVMSDYSKLSDKYYFKFM